MVNMGNLHVWIIAWTVCFSWLVVSERLSPLFDVELNVKSSWPRVSIVSEALEFVNDVDGGGGVVSAIELIGNKIIELSELRDVSDQQRINLIVESLNTTLFRSPFTGPFMALAIFNHYYSANVEFSRTLERRLRESMSIVPCSSDTYAAMCWLDDSSSYNVELFCDKSSLNSSSFAALSKTLDKQRFVGSSSNAKYHPCDNLRTDIFLRRQCLDSRERSCSVSGIRTPRLFLFSSFSFHSSTGQFIKAILEKVSGIATDVDIIFRHSDTAECRLPANPFHSITSMDDLCVKETKCCGDFLYGYGAELAVKNPEYKTMDTNSIGRDEALAKPLDNGGGKRDDNEEKEITTNKTNAVQASLEENPDRLLTEEEVSMLEWILEVLQVFIHVERYMLYEYIIFNCLFFLAVDVSWTSSSC